MADFKGETSNSALTQIVRRLEETTDGDFSLKRHFNQLRVLAQLRNLGTKLEETMDSIAQYVNEEKDALYLRGQKKEQIKFVTNLLLDTDFSTEKVSQIAGVSVDFVMDVKQKLSGQK